MPRDAGSPGSWISYGNYCGAGRGGGVIHVLAGGQMRIDGSLLANGGNGTLHGGSSGSGGLILLSSGRLLSGTGTLESRGATVAVHVWSLDNAHPAGGGRIAVWQCLPLSAAETRVAEHRTSGLTKVDELRAFDGVINVSEGPPPGHGATPGTVEYYNGRTTILILR